MSKTRLLAIASALEDRASVLDDNLVALYAKDLLELAEELDDDEEDTSIGLHQHCTYENQDGVDDYSFSHTAAYCGKPQPRRCGCAFCY